MWVCVSCLKQERKKVPKNLLIRACDVCGTPAVECAIENQNFNFGKGNWNKYVEQEDMVSSSQQQIPDNGLYIWLR